MGQEFLIIDKNILPEHFSMIIEIKELIGQGHKISEACKMVGLSRSTFYKYKDFVFMTSGITGKKANISIKMKEKGSFVEILQFCQNQNYDILNINKQTLVNNTHHILLTISINEITIDMIDVIKELKKLPNIKEVSLLATE